MLNPGGAQIGKPEIALPISTSVLTQANTRPSPPTIRVAYTRPPALLNDQVDKLATVKRKRRDQVDQAKAEVEIRTRLHQLFEEAVRRRAGDELITDPNHVRRRTRYDREQRKRNQPDRQVGRWSGECNGEILSTRVWQMPKLHEPAKHMDVDALRRHTIAARHLQVEKFVQQDRREDYCDKEHCQ